MKTASTKAEHSRPLQRNRLQGLSMENDLPFPLLKVLSTDLYPRWYFPDLMVRASLELMPSFAALVFFFGAISLLCESRSYEVSDSG